MSDKKTISRDALTKIATLVRPALATQTYIPVYNHIAFDGRTAMTHNDIAAICVKAPMPVECCIPGELLIKTLASFNGGEVMVREKADKCVEVVSGRSRISLPTMKLTDFPFELVIDDIDAEIELNEDVLKGIDLCLVSVGTNPNHAAQMGVTLDCDDGYAVLFSTDNASISRYATKTKLKLPGDAPVILPTFFCQQLIQLRKAFPKEKPILMLLADGLACEFGSEATLFIKTLTNPDPVDFPRVIAKAIDLKKVELHPIPASFDSSFQRALLVQGAALEKVTEVELKNGDIMLSSSTTVGDSVDDFAFEQKENDGLKFFVDPQIVVRGAKACSMLHLGKRAMVLGTEDGKFLHLIAHCSN